MPKFFGIGKVDIGHPDPFATAFPEALRLNGPGASDILPLRCRAKLLACGAEPAETYRGHFSVNVNSIDQPAGYPSFCP
jgi:hypothetical protein